MESRLPLSALLSQPLVAFTIEFDNEFEHRVPHRTSDHGSTPGAPWLVSMVMWSRFLRFIPEDGIPIQELQRVLQTDNKAIKVWLTRMGQWWGYVFLDENAVVRPTPGGRKALCEWRPLTGLIEARWRERFGEKTINRLCEILAGVSRQAGPELADSLPILGYGLFSNKPSAAPSKNRSEVDVKFRAGQKAGCRAEALPHNGFSSSELSLPGLLSKVLLAFAIEFERDAEVSLAISANVLRLVDNDGILIRELPRLSGVSKEAIAMSSGFLEKRGFAKIESSGRAKVLALTQKGHDARARYFRMVPQIETAWQESVAGLRDLLEGMAGDALFRGMEPYPDGWRASIPRPTVLPHYPMILHRGGFPDGS